MYMPAHISLKMHKNWEQNWKTSFPQWLALKNDQTNMEAFLWLALTAPVRILANDSPQMAQNLHAVSFQSPNVWKFVTYSHAQRWENKCSKREFVTFCRLSSRVRTIFFCQHVCVCGGGRYECDAITTTGHNTHHRRHLSNLHLPRLLTFQSWELFFLLCGCFLFIKRQVSLERYLTDSRGSWLGSFLLLHRRLLPPLQHIPDGNNTKWNRSCTVKSIFLSLESVLCCCSYVLKSERKRPWQRVKEIIPNGKNWSQPKF